MNPAPQGDQYAETVALARRVLGSVLLRIEEIPSGEWEEGEGDGDPFWKALDDVHAIVTAGLAKLHNEAGERLEAAETCAKLLRDHLTGDGGFGGKPTRLECEGCSHAVRAWERTAQFDGCRCGHARTSHGEVITRCTICECQQFDGHADEG